MIECKIELWQNLVNELDDLFKGNNLDKDNYPIFNHLFIMKEFLLENYEKENKEKLKEILNEFLTKYEIGNKQNVVHSKILEIKNILKRLDRKLDIENHYHKICNLIKDENLSAIKNFVGKRYEYVNAFNKEGKTIFETIIDEFLKIDTTDLVKQVFYLEVIDFFLKNQSFNFDESLKLTILTKIKTNSNNKWTEYLVKKITNKEDITLEELFYKMKKKENFPSKVMKHIILDQVDFGKRVEYLDQHSITIDSKTTTCMDDALYVEEDSNVLKVYVHIADASPFVLKNSNLDYEARKRGETLFINKVSVIPMLPLILCEDKNSLREGVIRPSYTFTILFDKESHNILKNNEGNYIKIESSLIRVKYHLSCEEANHFLINGSGIKELDKVLLYLAKISQTLHSNNKRDKNYDLLHTFFSGEKNNSKYVLNSEKIISEFMILVGHLISDFCYKNDIPFIYRVHEQVLNNLDYEEINLVINKLGEKKLTKGDVYLLNEVKNKVLTAKFSCINIGHFGLGLSSYSQVTSPLRRYGDLYNLRFLMSYLNGKITNENKEKEEMEKIANYLNNLKRINEYFSSEYNYVFEKNKKKTRKK